MSAHNLASKLGRVLRTGLSSLRDRAASRLAGSRFNPSRWCSPWRWPWHFWHKVHGRAFEIGGKIVGVMYDKRCLRCGTVHKDRWLPL